MCDLPFAFKSQAVSVTLTGSMVAWTYENFIVNFKRYHQFLRSSCMSLSLPTIYHRAHVYLDMGVCILIITKELKL